MVLIALRQFGALVADLVPAVALAEELGDVGKRRVGDVGEGLGRQECLVGRDDDVGHRDQARERVVVDDVVGVVVEEDVGFLLVDVQAGRAYLALLDTLYKRLSVDQGASGRVYEYNTLLHAGDCFGIDHVAVLVGQRTVERDDVAALPQFVERNVVDTASLSRELVVRDHIHTETAAYINEDPSYLTCADDTDCLAVQVKARQPVEAEIEILCADVRLVDPAHRCQQQRDGVLRNCVGRICGNADNVDLAVRVLNVDIVVARAAKRDQAHAHSIELVDNGPVDIIVDENAHRITSLRQRTCVLGEAGLIVAYVETFVLVLYFEGVPVVLLGVKKRDLDLVHMHTSTITE